MIVAQAGVYGAVTIATNMAGRGTDIQLGGNLEMKLKSVLTGTETPEQIAEIKERLKQEIETDKEKVLAAGGLYILGTERHESRRIDNQLRGRSGRQGDPGTSKFFLSMEDDLMRIFGSERMSAVLKKLGLPEGEALVHPWISKALEKAQQKVEERNFDIRKNLLKYDNVMNEQRKVIYEQRKELMEAEDVSETIKDIRQEYLRNLIAEFIPYGSSPENWQKDELKQELAKATGFVLPVSNWANEPEIDSDDITQKILDEVEKRLVEKNADIPEQLVKMVEKSLLLQVLDQLWKEHIATLDMMRHTIVLRAYGQKDPLNEYKREAFNMFSNLLDRLKENVTIVVCRSLIRHDTADSLQQREQQQQNMKMREIHDQPQNLMAEPKPEENARLASDQAAMENPFGGKIARNDPCPCGSGKKFKHCHGRIA
jgi:preprotein translocase subunit SecA